MNIYIHTTHNSAARKQTATTLGSLSPTVRATVIVGRRDEIELKTRTVMLIVPPSRNYLYRKGTSY